MSLTLNHTVQRKSPDVQSQIDDELVLMNNEQDCYFGLNSVATDIWAMIDKPITVEALCQTLCEKYDVSVEQCQKDVLIYLNDLQEKALLDIVE